MNASVITRFKRLAQVTLAAVACATVVACGGGTELEADTVTQVGHDATTSQVNPGLNKMK